MAQSTISCANFHVITCPRSFATGRWCDRAYEVVEEFTGGTLADLPLEADGPEAIRILVTELGQALHSLSEAGSETPRFAPLDDLRTLSGSAGSRDHRLRFRAPFGIRPRYRLAARDDTLHGARSDRRRCRTGLGLVESGHDPSGARHKRRVLRGYQRASLPDPCPDQRRSASGKSECRHRAAASRPARPRPSAAVAMEGSSGLACR